MAKSGLPANTNPFSLNRDNYINDEALVAEFPQYFKLTKNGDNTHCPLFIQTPALSQDQIEALMFHIVDCDVVGGSFAVKKDFMHIIPIELRSKVFVTKSRKPTCRNKDCYHLT